MRLASRSTRPAATPAAAVIAAAALAAIALTACPLPYKYSPEGYPGDSAGADPSTPDISAAPVALYTESSGRSGAVADGQSATTSSDTQIAFSSDTLGAVIYYTVDGSVPDPRSPSTRKYQKGSPYSLRIDAPSADRSSDSVTVRATAIGPNMKPSLVTQATVRVQYPQVAAPQFDLKPGTYRSSQTVGLSSSTPGARIYFTMATGDGEPPRPVPGQEGTEEYHAPISIRDTQSVWTIAAIAVKDQLIPSAAITARYTIIPTCAMPIFGILGGEQTVYNNEVIVFIQPGVSGSMIYYSTDGPPSPNGQGEPTEFELPLPGNETISNGTVHLSAIATKGNAVSDLQEKYFTFQAAAPDLQFIEISPVIGNQYYTGPITIGLSSITEDAQIFYRTDKAANWAQYAGPIKISSTTSFEWYAAKDKYLVSGISSTVFYFAPSEP